MRKYDFTKEQVSEIKVACKKITDKWALRHLEMLYLRALGGSLKEITEKTGFSETTIRRAVQEYRADGLESMVKRLCAVNRHVESSYEFTPAQVSELAQAYEAATNKRIARRFKALLLRAEGKNIKEAASITGLNTTTIRRLAQEYQCNGIATIGILRQTKHKYLFTAYKYKFTVEQKVEIELARRTVTDKRALARLEVLHLRAEGKNVPEVGTITGFHPAHITKLIRKYQENGLEAIIGNHYKHRVSQRYMDYDEETEIMKTLRTKVKNGQPLTTSEIKVKFEAAIGHSVGDAWVRKILKRHHWHYCHKSWMPPSEI